MSRTQRSNTKFYSISNSNGMLLTVNSLGATIMSLMVPDNNNKLINVVVGLDQPDDYTNSPYIDSKLYLGSIVGRFAGRISGEEFELNDKKYPIYNENGVHLHGGKTGFDKKTWNVDKIEEGEESTITFSYVSPHLEEGYPGNLRVKIRYSLTKGNSLIITHRATTDKATIVNLTNHSYFNLDGEDSILNHKLQINSDKYLEVDNSLLPTGNILPVDKTAFDFKDIDTIKCVDFIGLDNTYILNETHLKVSLVSDNSGIKMNVYTNQPAVVVYTPKKFPELPFKNSVKYSKYPAICFETQGYPNAPDFAHFPSTVLNPEEEYINKSIFEFKNLR